MRRPSRISSCPDVASIAQSKHSRRVFVLAFRHGSLRLRASALGLKTPDLLASC